MKPITKKERKIMELLKGRFITAVEATRRLGFPNDYHKLHRLGYRLFMEREYES